MAHVREGGGMTALGVVLFLGFWAIFIARCIARGSGER